MSDKIEVFHWATPLQLTLALYYINPLPHWPPSNNGCSWESASFYLPFMVLSVTTIWDSCNLDFSSRTRSTRSVGIIAASGNLCFQRHSCAKGKVAVLTGLCHTALLKCVGSCRFKWRTLDPSLCAFRGFVSLSHTQGIILLRLFENRTQRKIFVLQREAVIIWGRNILGQELLARYH